jgi:hypothetical protein
MRDMNIKILPYITRSALNMTHQDTHAIERIKLFSWFILGSSMCQDVDHPIPSARPGPVIPVIGITIRTATRIAINILAHTHTLCFWVWVNICKNMFFSNPPSQN